MAEAPGSAGGRLRYPAHALREEPQLLEAGEREVPAEAGEMNSWWHAALADGGEERRGRASERRALAHRVAADISAGVGLSRPVVLPLGCAGELREPDLLADRGAAM
eukprot:557759-Hanusia_phi.AAC.2